MLLAEAVRLHQAGQLEQAAALYQNVLALEPHNADAVHLLGFLAYQGGRADTAIGLISRAIARNGNAAPYHFHLALAFKAVGRLDEAAASYRQALKLKPGDSDMLNNLGNVLAQAGRFEEAVTHYRQVLAAAPGNARALINLGNALSELGRMDEAEASYRKAVALEPDNAAAHNNLGNLFRGRGDMDRAIACYRKALAITPGDATMHNNLGIALWNRGDRDQAVASYHKALALDANHVEARDNLAIALWQQGAPDEAEAQYRQIRGVRPGDPEINANYAALLLAGGKAQEAMAMIRQSLAVKETAQARKLFVELARSGQGLDDAQSRALLLRALTEPWDRPARLAAAAARLIASGPLAAMVVRANDAWPARLALAELLGGANLGAITGDALLMGLLTVTPNTDMRLERFLTQLRGALLQADGQDPDLLSALARQCFINEYVFLPDEAEIAMVDNLHAAIAAHLENDTPADDVSLLKLATYRPLHSLSGAEHLLARQWPQAMADVLVQQVREPLEERRLGLQMPRLTPIADAVSLAVQSQYEQNPYPRWVKQPPTARENPAKFLAQRFPLARFDRRPMAQAEILVAGCGTGQHSIATAERFGALLAVDLSVASLAYAQRKSNELGLPIAYGQADILELGKLGRQFDVIESVGVLHHMAEPYAGWAALLPLLKPGGFMWLGFYSALARTSIARTRAEIAGQNLAPSADNIRRFRQQFADRPGAPAEIIGSEDFFSISACRDLLFHSHEQGFTLAGIARFIAEQGLTFLGFDIHDAVLDAYRRRFAGDPAATDLSNWANFEADNPGLFAAMYVFWVQKPL
jgi:tetratricopeptide (TPR) repeat protein/2-polyprenyl-3-methyl-5-hydroxy-6-metoxy-1,4-benzoquinol methylase